MTDLVAVVLLGFPLRLHEQAVEHHEELMREFQLLAIDPPQSTPGHHVPRRLVELVAELTAAYAGVAEAPDAERDAALARGAQSVDLTYYVPQSVGDACLRLDRMLDEADDLCRAGEQLLTLATPPEAAAFRRWYLSEFPAQLAGAPPTSWAAYSVTASRR